LNEQEWYLFDLQGYLVVENVLTPAHLDALNAELDRQIAAVNDPDRPWFRWDGLLPWGKPFQDLIDPAPLLPYLKTLLGEGFRLDHDYVHIIRQGKGPIGTRLHGGGTPYDPCQYYHVHDGRMYNGLTAVAYELRDVAPGEGGFACVPGSHKSNAPFPDEWRDLEHPPACVQPIAIAAGSAIVFTEALTHGTLPWRGTGERRTLFYKYSPRSNAWARSLYNPDEFPGLSKSQRRLLLSPGIYPY